MAPALSHLRLPSAIFRAHVTRYIPTPLQLYRDVSLREYNTIVVNSRLEPVNLRSEQRVAADLRDEAIASLFATDAEGQYAFSKVLLELQLQSERAGAAVSPNFTPRVEVLGGERSVVYIGNCIAIIPTPIDQLPYNNKPSNSALELVQISEVPTAPSDFDYSFSKYRSVSHRFPPVSTFAVGLGISAVFGLGFMAARFPTPLISLVARIEPSMSVVAGHIGSVALTGLRSIGALYMNATDAVLSSPITSCLSSILSGCALGAWITAETASINGHSRIASLSRFRNAGFDLLVRGGTILSERWWLGV